MSDSADLETLLARNRQWAGELTRSNPQFFSRLAQQQLPRYLLSLDSAYNTYKHSGLPPGPIANPGLPSLEAALKPATVDYLYFVSDNKGRHVFSKTLDEHNRAVTAYRRSLRLESTKAPELKQGKLQSRLTLSN